MRKHSTSARFSRPRGFTSRLGKFPTARSPPPSRRLRIPSELLWRRDSYPLGTPRWTRAAHARAWRTRVYVRESACVPAVAHLVVIAVRKLPHSGAFPSTSSQPAHASAHRAARQSRGNQQPTPTLASPCAHAATRQSAAWNPRSAWVGRRDARCHAQRSCPSSLSCLVRNPELNKTWVTSGLLGTVLTTVESRKRGPKG